MQDCSPRRRGSHAACQISRFICSALISIAVLPGCQTASERRVAEGESRLREMNAKSQTDSPVPTLQATSDTSPLIKTNNNSKQEKSLGMSLYPGSKPYMEGPTTLSNTGDGIAMMLLETQDSVDKVMLYYKAQLNSNSTGNPANQLTVKEENRNGKRTLRLTKPFPTGGLQSVEAKEEEGKTIIELMNLQSVAAGKPIVIPDLNAKREKNSPRSE